MKRLAHLLLTAALGLVLAAWSAQSAPGIQPTAVSPDPEASLSPTAPAEAQLPTQAVTFKVILPPDTPEDEQPYLLLLSFQDWHWLEHIPLEKQPDGSWMASVDLERGALIRYTYDRWDEQSWGETFKASREATTGHLPIEARYLLVEQGMPVQRDIVAEWSDLPLEHKPVSLRGVVIDAQSGEPLVDVNVSVGGLLTATDYDGGFRVDGLPPGEQRVTVFALEGHHLAKTISQQLPDAQVLELRLEPAEPVQVRFEVSLPADTPAEVQIRLAGNLWAFGARPGRMVNLPANVHLPLLERIDADHAAISLELYQGSYAQYSYTLHAPGLSDERDADGRSVLRSFVVDTAAALRKETIEAWRWPQGSRVELRIATPPGTPKDVPLVAELGPTHWLTQAADGDWILILHGNPGETQDFRILLGGIAPGLADGVDRFQVDFAAEDQGVHLGLDSWEHHPPPAPAGSDGLIPIEFWVALPPTTPHDDQVYLWIDTADPPQRYPMQRLDSDPWLAQGRLRLPPGEEFEIGFDRGEPGTESISTHRLPTANLAGRLNIWVSGWRDQLPPGDSPRQTYLAGYFPPDYWSETFLPLSNSTFARIAENGGGWVALSSVWSFGQSEPLPLVEPRAMHSPSVLAPRQDLISQGRMAAEQQLEILLAPQFNMEMNPATQGVCGPHDAEWWLAFLEQARRLWLWNAQLASELQAAGLLLPGPCFHVFGPEGFFPSEAFVDFFDTQMAALIAEVRAQYPGKLLITGSSPFFEFPGLADWIGVTTYDTGHPDLPPETPPDGWAQAYERLFVERLDPLHARWGLPVLFYTVHIPSRPSAGDEAGELAQARQLEGLLRAIDRRSWIAGSFSWSYSMVDAPLEVGDGLRGRLAEAVLARYYQHRMPGTRQE